MWVSLCDSVSVRQLLACGRAHRFSCTKIQGCVKLLKKKKHLCIMKPIAPSSNLLTMSNEGNCKGEKKQSSVLC